MDAAVAAFRAGKEKEFIEAYPYDISVVKDDNPFFYKYYKFRLGDTFLHPGGGAVAFHVQLIIVVQTLVFIFLFVFAPLYWSRRAGTALLPRDIKLPFIVYFSSLGAGFILIEITLMQRFALALGSPIYSISVCLAALLISTGVGSLLSGKLRSWVGTEVRLIWILAAAVAVYLVAMVLCGTSLLNLIVRTPFFARVLLTSLLLFPIGACLGVFFPAGLLFIGSRSPKAIAWAWGINSGFTVLGSTVSVIIAQFLGFNVVLLMAAALYLAAAAAYRRMLRTAGDGVQT
jgi:hypothetical protein